MNYIYNDKKTTNNLIYVIKCNEIGTYKIDKINIKEIINYL